VLNATQLEELKLNPLQAYVVKSENGRLILTPSSHNSTAADEEQFEECMADIHARFGNAMKRLAE
jgi:hypothetical protein